MEYGCDPHRCSSNPRKPSQASVSWRIHEQNEGHDFLELEMPNFARKSSTVFPHPPMNLRSALRSLAFTSSTRRSSNLKTIACVKANPPFAFIPPRCWAQTFEHGPYSTGSRLQRLAEAIWEAKATCLIRPHLCCVCVCVSSCKGSS